MDEIDIIIEALKEHGIEARDRGDYTDPVLGTYSRIWTRVTTKLTFQNLSMISLPIFLNIKDCRVFCCGVDSGEGGVNLCHPDSIAIIAQAINDCPRDCGKCPLAK